MVVNALTIDFEDWYHGIELPQSEWRHCAARLPYATGRLLEILADRGVLGTFFVLGAAAEKHPRLVTDLAQAGHEIGTHGWSHEFVYEQEPEQFCAELKRSVDLLRDLTGRKVRGFRAPYFSITRQSWWALEQLADGGIEYDSSVFPVRNYRYGIPDAPRWPHKIATPAGEIVEFPITTYKLGPWRIPMAGGAYFRLLPYRVTRAAFRRLNAQGRAVSFYLHPWELDPDHPRIDLPRRIAATHYANLDKTDRRLRRLLEEFQFAPMGEVIDDLQ